MTPDLMLDATLASPPSSALPRVAVIVLTHNRQIELLRTLTRLTTLPDPPPIYVVDNASRDGTAAAVAARFPQVSLIRLDHNIGAAARNEGARQVQARYIAFCDDDTWWAPGALERAADLLDAYPSLAAVTGRVLVGPYNREDPTSAKMADSPLPNLLGFPGKEILGLMAGACMIRRTAFLAVGGYQPRLFLGGEEWLVTVDLAAEGWHLAYVPDVVIHHHPSSLRDALARRRLLLRNSLWCTWLRRPASTALRMSLRQLGGVLREPALLPALIGAVAGLPWVLRYRKVVPPNVEVALRKIETPRRHRKHMVFARIEPQTGK